MTEDKSKGKQPATVQSDDEIENASDHDDAGAAAGGSSEAAAKKSKKQKVKDALTGKKEGPGPGPGGLTRDQLEKLASLNPTLKRELAGKDEAQLQALMKQLNVGDLLTGLAPTGKNQKDMANYKFWKTQPVPSFEDPASTEDGEIQKVDPEKVPKEPPPMYEGFEWVTMDLTQAEQLEEVYDLLSYHYVEDKEAMFRFNYSAPFLKWALMSPGWRKEWHVGVRATKSRKLVAFISGIPVDLKVRKNVLKCSEINFLVIHKKLRGKRLAPVMIKEVTRRCHMLGIYQAVYTSGTILPRPVSTCRYFHRSLDWEKLYDIGFSPLPPGSTKQKQLLRFKLPSKTETEGLRPMEEKDVAQVRTLLNGYLGRTSITPEFSEEEVKHWFVHHADPKSEDRVVWAYVVENHNTSRLTDFFSFYSLPSTAINNTKHPILNAAYLYYYATDLATCKDDNKLKKRLNQLVHDALILAKQAKFDVFNALTLHDNPLFLEDQKFGAGDGQLHYYLYNWRTAPIPGGVDKANKVSVKNKAGVGLVML